TLKNALKACSIRVKQGVLPTFSLRAASSLSFGRRDKAAESGDVDYEYHHIIKGLYATFSSWHTDPCRLFIPI
uniref:hypothetical protein n=1 Tax=Prevotella sp. TaxID=59823 RepID=UPI004026FCB1